jgi:hypothetical protein
MDPVVVQVGLKPSVNGDYRRGIMPGPSSSNDPKILVCCGFPVWDRKKLSVMRQSSASSRSSSTNHSLT